MSNQKMIYSAVLMVMVFAFAAGCSATAVPAIVGTSSQPSAQAGGGPGAVQPVGNLPVQPSAPSRTITVVGTGRAPGAPDVARVNVGVETRAASVQQAVADNKDRMSQLLDALKAFGIAEKDIQTSNYGVYAERQPVSGADIGRNDGPVTYQVNNQVFLTVRDVAKLGNVLEKAVAAGATNIYGVNFSVADTSKLEADARAKAIADARSRAESLAKLSGVAVGDVLGVSEVIGGSGPIYEGARMSAASGLGGGGGAPIQPGEMEVNISVQVTFAIK